MDHPRTRNDAIERLLREAPGPFAEAAPGPCVSPEDMAAWADGGLSGSHAARVEAHVASCPDCQALVAAFARATPAQGRAWTSLRWAAPVAAAAVLVLAVWLNRPAEDAPTAPAADTQVARLEEAPATLPGAPAAPAPDPRADRSLDLRRQASSSGSANQAAAPGAMAGSPPASAAPAAAPPAEAAEAAPRADREAPEARSKALASPESKALASPDLSRAEADQPARPAPQGLGDLAARAPAASEFRQRAEGPALVLVSPSGRTRCRIDARGTLERSNDGGQSFVEVVGPARVNRSDVVGGASPSDGVCWLVGRAGLVILVRDGLATIVRLPDAGDLTSVQADGAGAPVIRGADGRVWRTQDGGTTWSAVPTGR